MNRTVIIWSFVLTVLFALAGWFLVKQNDVSPVSDNDTWATFENSLSGFSKSPDPGPAILASGMIGGADLNESLVQDTDEGPPPFPAILSASVVNGVPQVHLKGGNTGVMSANAGDTLESGWQLLSVNLSGVVASYGDEQRTIAITNYDLQPEPKNGEVERR